MPLWTHRAVLNNPRNGTTTTTLAFGKAMAPGSLVVVAIQGAVTHTFPAPWVKQQNPINNTEYAVATLTAGGGETQVAVTHNGSNYPTVSVVWEFPPGSTYGPGAQASNQTASAAWTALAGVAAGSTVVACTSVTIALTATTATASTAWTNPPTEVADVVAVGGGTGSTDGAYASVAEQEEHPGGSFTPSHTTTTSSSLTGERVWFAVAPPSDAFRSSSQLVAHGTPRVSMAAMSTRRGA